MVDVNSIGNSIKNFFSTTVKVDSYQSGENGIKDSITTTLDKSVIRKALFRGCGLIGMLKGMKAIRQAGCDLTKVGELGGRLGCAMDVIKKTITQRSITAPRPGAAGQSGSKNGVDEFKAMVEDKTFTETLNKYEKHVTANEDDPLARHFLNSDGIEHLLENNPKVLVAEMRETASQLSLGSINAKNEMPKKSDTVIHIPANNE